MDYDSLKRIVERQNRIIEATGLGTWEYNFQTTELIINEHWAQILGYKLAELGPINMAEFRKFVNPDDYKVAFQKFHDHIQGKTEFYETEVRLKHRAGHWIWVLDKGKIVSHTADGKAEWLMGSHQEITTRKNNEVLLTHYRELLQRTKEVALIGSWELNLMDAAVTWNPMARKIYEVDRNFALTFDQYVTFYPDGANRQKIRDLISNAVTSGQTFDEELPIITAAGNKKWVRLIGIPIFEGTAGVDLYGLVQDITQKNQAMRAIALQEEQFRQTFDYAPNGIALVSLDGKWLRVNSALCEMVGYSSEELLDLSFQDITHPDDLKKDLELVQEMLAGKRQSYLMEKRYFHKSGESIWASLSVSIVRNPKGKPLYFVSQITDITRNKLLELRLRESNRRMLGILNASTRVGIVETDHLGIIQLFNLGAQNLLGYSEEEVVRKKSPEVFYTPQEITARKEKLALRSQRVLNGFELLTYHLREHPYEVGEWTYVRKNGSHFHVHLTTTAVQKEDGEISGYLLIFVDISALKEVEKEAKTLLDVTQNQNKRLLNFAHIVSHNLRSHAGNISMILNLIKVEAANLADDEYYPMLEEASKNLMTTIDHLNEITLINAQRSEDLRQLFINEYVNSCLGTLSAYIIESNTIVINELKDDLVIFGLPAYLESILLNILSNAIKYRSQTRQPVIHISYHVKGIYLIVEITDNGLGIDLTKNADKIFGLYKTFHGNDDARGIGLFITKSQIEAMGGKVEVDSEVGEGTTFTLYLRMQDN